MARNRVLLIFSLLFSSACIYGQGIGINTEQLPPHPSAILDIQSTSQGILIPRMTQEQREQIVDPAPGLLIYQTDNNPGLYTNNGAIWNVLAAGQDVWTTTGNSGTDPNIQFLGTTDASPLRIRLNNFWAGELNSATSNASIGDSAGISITSGLQNTSFGHKSMRLNATGQNNTAIGYRALSKCTTSGSTAIGSQALMSNTSGFENTALGAHSLRDNTTGAFNTSLGRSALQNNTTGNGNTAGGNKCMLNNLGGFDNTAVGHQCMIGNVSGNQNAAYGSYSLANNTTGSMNTSIGAEALFLATQNENTAIGASALRYTSIGFNNTAIGAGALKDNQTGSNNVAIGRNSGNALINIFNSISIGNYNYLNGDDNQVFIGNLGIEWTGGNTNWSLFSDARVKTDVREDVAGLSFIKQLRPVTYYRDIDLQAALTGNAPIEDTPHSHDIEQVRFSGFLAQEVEQAALACGYDFSGITAPKNEHSLYTLSYDSFVVPMVKAMQEQQVIIENLLNQAEEQNEKINALVERLADLEIKLKGE